jgi:CTP-dependent riboflavin kinase
MLDGVELRGIVRQGRGLGVGLLSQPGVMARFRAMFGFDVVAGTLNVRLAGHFNRRIATRYVAASEIAPTWRDVTGQSGYFTVSVLVEDRYRGVAFQADEPGYPVDLLELLCEVHLRTTLGLRGGDVISVTLATGRRP